MSSLTKAEFITELEGRSSVIASFTDAAIGSFIDIALRAYSALFPELRVSADNEVVDGQDLYDFPTNALRITKILDSESRQEIGFSIENQGSGDQIRLGDIIRSSVSELLESAYYVNPVALSVSTQVTGYSTFDIEYTLLQDMDTLKDTSLEAIASYVEYLACDEKAKEVSVSAVSSSERVAESITDQDSSGASTTIKYASSKEMTVVLKQQAEAALARYNDATRGAAYGTRG